MFYVKKKEDNSLTFAYEEEENAVAIDDNEEEFYKYFYNREDNVIYKRHMISYIVEMVDDKPVIVFDCDHSLDVGYEVIVDGRTYKEGAMFIEKATVSDEETGELIEEIIPSLTIGCTVNCSIVLESKDSRVCFDPIYISSSEKTEEEHPRLELQTNSISVGISKIQEKYLSLKDEVDYIKTLIEPKTGVETNE